MRVLIAPAHFKGTLSAAEAASAMAEGVLHVYPEAVVTIVPMDDDGAGGSGAVCSQGDDDGGTGGAGGGGLPDGFEADPDGFDAVLAEADLVLTGEGSLDERSPNGAGTLYVARRAQEAGVPAVVVAGRITLAPQKLAEYGVVAGISLLDLASESEVIDGAFNYVRRATQQVLEGA